MESSNQTAQSDSGLRDQAVAALGDARRSVGSAVETVRVRTGNLQAQLADVLDTGAAALRRRATTTAPVDTLEGETERTSVIDSALPRIAAQGELVANVMENGAIWLRENDLSDLEARVMNQIEQHPLRTLGIAAMVGLLIARRD